MARLADEAAEDARTDQARPSWADWRALGATEPLPDADGVRESRLDMDLRTPEGRRAFAAMGEALEPSFRRESDSGQRRGGMIPKAIVRGPNGVPREVPEHHAERVERKFFVPHTFGMPNLRPGWQWRCEAGHRFGFTRALRQPRPTDCPDCGGDALAERA